MELLRPCLFFYLLAIVLSLSISSTTNSDPSSTEALQWKGGAGVKKSRLRRQYLDLQHALRLPEKAYVFYMLWRLLNEVYNDTNTIQPLTLRPDKLSFTTSERPKNTEIKAKTSSAPTQEQSTHSTDSLADSLLIEQQKILEQSEVTEEHILDSTLLPINSSSTTEEIPSSVGLPGQIDHLTGINGTNLTSVESFPIDSTPDLQETTQSGDLQQTTEPIEVTEHYILDSTLFQINSSPKVEEPSLTALPKKNDHFNSINVTNLTSVETFPIVSLPDLQETTQSGDLQHSQNTEQIIIEPGEDTEQHILDSTLLPINISSQAEEEPSSIGLPEQINHFTGINGTNSTYLESFLFDPLPDSQETTQSGDPPFVEQALQHNQTTEHKITEPRDVTEQHILDSTTFTNDTFSKAAEITSTALHNQIDFTGFVDANSTAVFSFPIQSSSDSQKTQSGDSKLHEESAQRKIPENITRSIGIIGVNDSKVLTDWSLQDSLNNTQSGAPQLIESSRQHFQNHKQKITKPSQKFRRPALKSTLDQATTYGIQQETPLQSTKNQHTQNNAIHASTVENDNLQPTSLPLMTKNKQPKITPIINGLVKSISKPSTSARTKQTTLSTDKPEIIKNPPQTPSVTWQNEESDWLVTATDWRVSKHSPPKFTLTQQIQDSTSLLLTEDNPNSHLSESISDPKHHKPKTTEKPINQHTEKNTTNGAKSSRDSLMQSFMTTKAHRQTNDTLVISKMASTSTLPIQTENHFVDSKGPEDTSELTGTSLQNTTPFVIHRSNAKTQRTTNKYTVFGKIRSHTSFPLVKDKSNQTPRDEVQSSQTISVSTKKLIMMFTPNPKPPGKHIHSTSVISDETEESQLDSMNQGVTAVDSVPKQHYTSNDLPTETDKPTQNTIGHETSTVSQTTKSVILPARESANRTIIFGLLMTFVCFMLLTIMLLWVILRKWQGRHRGSNMWVAGPPLLRGTYQSVLQNSSSHTAIQMRKEKSQKKKQENNEVHEMITLKQQHKDLV